MSQENIKYLSKQPQSALANKSVLVRVDYNAPVKDGQISDDFRIASTLPTISYLVQQGAKVILASHNGRPNGIQDDLSLRNAAVNLESLLGQKVLFIDGKLDSTVKERLSGQKPGDVALLENLRFNGGERSDHSTDIAVNFALGLRSIADIYVNDAFSACHNDDVSVALAPKFFERKYCGLLLEKEIALMETALSRPKEGYVLLIGGAKVKDKLPLIKNLSPKVETVMLGGMLANSVLNANGVNVYDSKVEVSEDVSELAGLARSESSKFLLPGDFYLVDLSLAQDGPKAVMDIGMKTLEMYKSVLAKATTVVHAGPLGKFEAPGCKASYHLARHIASLDCFKLVGGGETVSLYSSQNLHGSVNASTGGGAMLAYLAGKNMPGINALNQSK